MNQLKRILFLNPPGKKIYIRDYYCSKVSKAYYLPQPVDLLIQSAFFDSLEYDIKVLDCIAEKKNSTQALQEIKQFAPNYIVGLMGSVSLEEDRLFYEEVKEQNLDCIIGCSGDALLEKYDDKFQKYPWLNAIITNFFTNGFQQYIENSNDISGLVFRQENEIIKELKHLKSKGYKFIYFSDQTFFQSKAVTNEVLNWMVNENYGLSWMCFSRVDVLNEKELTLMKKAGCKLIMFGVEWAEDKLLTHYKKHYNTEQIRNTFKLTKELGIKRLGTFLIGVPGQSKASILNTISFAKEIQADYASFNVAVPRSNTSFRTEALDYGLIDDSLEVMDQSGNEVTIGTGTLSKEEIQKLKNKAYKAFYFRPSYILKRLLNIGSWTEFKIHLTEGAYIFKGLFSKS